eukprot:SAG31_NODE_21776_length_541_cov_0.755656_1_plen_25_part_10
MLVSARPEQADLLLTSREPGLVRRR